MRRREAAAERGRGAEVERVREPNEVDLRARQRYQLGERAPLGEPGLELVVADLLVAVEARPTDAAGADKRHRDALAHPPSADLGSHLGDRSRQFVAWHVRQ